MAIIRALVRGGKVTAARRLGPLLGPLVPVAEVIREINQKTEKYEGHKINIKLLIDERKKTTQVIIEKVPDTVQILQKLSLARKAHKNGISITKKQYSLLTDMPNFINKEPTLKGILKSMNIKII